MKLIDIFETRAQEQVHHNPSVATLKSLARNNKYHSARFVITKSGDVVAGDSEYYTHHSMAPYDGAWDVRGYVQYMGDNDYAYRSMAVYSALNKDHPILRIWERAGIENGNPDQSGLTEAVHTKFESGLDADELEDLLDAVEYEQEEINTQSYDADSDQDRQLDQAFKALEAVAFVIKNNLIALKDPKLNSNSVFMYDYRETGLFGVAAIQVWVEDSVAQVKWLGSYNKPKGTGNQLLQAALLRAKQMGATHSQVMAKWSSEGFYVKSGYVITDPGTYNPFTDSTLVKLEKPLPEAWSKSYKQSINCNNPRGFSQRAHCAGRKARQAHKSTRSKSVNEMNSQPEVLQSFGLPTRSPLCMPYVKLNQVSEHNVHLTSSYNNWIRYTPASLQSDWSEYAHKAESKWRRRAEQIGARWPMFDSMDQFQQALDQAEIVNVDQLGDVENLTRNLSVADIKHMVGGYQNPRDVDRIIQGLQNHVALPLPIIIKGSRGMWIQAGNTRQATARVMGAVPRALLVDLSV